MSEYKADVECITEGCDNFQQSRGLCTKCCSTARGMVKKGQTTWEFLESKGMSLKLKNTTESLFKQQFSKLI